MLKVQFFKKNITWAEKNLTVSPVVFLFKVSAWPLKKPIKLHKTNISPQKMDIFESMIFPLSFRWDMWSVPWEGVKPPDVSVSGVGNLGCVFRQRQLQGRKPRSACTSRFSAFCRSSSRPLSWSWSFTTCSWETGRRFEKYVVLHGLGDVLGRSPKKHSRENVRAFHLGHA